MREMGKEWKRRERTKERGIRGKYKYERSRCMRMWKKRREERIE